MYELDEEYVMTETREAWRLRSADEVTQECAYLDAVEPLVRAVASVLAALWSEPATPRVVDRRQLPIPGAL